MKNHPLRNCLIISFDFSYNVNAFCDFEKVLRNDAIVTEQHGRVTSMSFSKVMFIHASNLAI